MKRAMIATLAWLLGACAGPPPLLEGIRAQGEIRIATLASRTTYYPSTAGPRGFEHDMAARFAAHIGVAPRFIVAGDTAELFALLTSRKVHLAAALLPVEQLRAEIAFGPSYHIIEQLLIYRRGTPRPRNIEQLKGRRIVASAGSGSRPLLIANLPRAEGYDWTIRSDVAAEDLLAMVSEKRVDYVLLPSTEFHIARNVYPETRAAFAVGAPQVVGWARAPATDHSLAQAQLEFLRAVRVSGELSQIADRYFGHLKQFDYVEVRSLLRHYSERLPRYRDSFIAAGERHGVDWRLLAALSYQESHWRPNATSPTGVKGLMMLTRDTAQEIGVDRLDPDQAIDGGSVYLAGLRARLPRRFGEPDRTWFALAAYNIGLGHLEDARVLTQRAGHDPDRWVDVRNHLPKLAHGRWAEQARHGRARGNQAVEFVRNIRRYYDVITWLAGAAAAPAAAEPARYLPALRAL